MKWEVAVLEKKNNKKKGNSGKEERKKEKQPWGENVHQQKHIAWEPIDKKHEETEHEHR